MPATIIVLFLALLLFIPFITVVLLSLLVKLPTKLTGKQAAWVWAVCISYYVSVYYGSNYLLDHYFPLHSEQKTVCEVKTTYWREGLN